MIKKTGAKLEVDLMKLLPNAIKIVVFLIMGVIAFYSLKADVAVLTERIDNIEKYMHQDIKEIKELLKRQDQAGGK